MFSALARISRHGLASVAFILFFFCARAWSHDPDDPYDDPKLTYSIPYSQLIRRAAGVTPEMEKKKAPDPKAPIPPALLAAYKDKVAKDAPVAEYRARRAAYDAANRYASEMAGTAASLAPTYDLGNGRSLAVTGISVPTPPVNPNPQAEIAAEQADNAYWDAYVKYGDPSGRLPLPENYTEDHRPLISISPVGVTSDNRILAITTGGTNRDIPSRLWMVDTSAANVVLQAGSVVKKNGRDYGKIASFSVSQADANGRLLLLARLKDVPPERFNSDILVQWTEKEGAQVVATSDDVSNDGQNQPVIFISKYVMSPEGDIALFCPAVKSGPTRSPVSRVFVWSPGKLRVAATELPSATVEIIPPSTQPRRNGYSQLHYRFQIGSKTIDFDPATNTLDLSMMKWLPNGDLGFFGTEARVVGRVKLLFGRMWTCRPQTGDSSNFETGDSNTSWFGPENSMAIMDERPGVGGEPGVIPTKLRAGTLQNTTLLMEFVHAKVPGINPDQHLAGADPKGRKTTVALGPGHKIAFTAYLTGKEPPHNPPPGGKHSPHDLLFDPKGPFEVPQWVLIAGTVGDPGSLRVIADEAMIADASAGGGLPAGTFDSLVFTSKGVLVFTTTDRLSRKYLRLYVEEPWSPPHFCWSWDSTGLHRLALFRTTIDTQQGPRSAVAGFSFQYAGDDRCVFNSMFDNSTYVVDLK